MKYFFAADKLTPGELPNLPTATADSSLQTILNTVYFWAGIVCVIMIVIAGFMYVTSAGNSSTVQKAKNAILGAIIGLVVTIGAFAITAFVTGRLT